MAYEEDSQADGHEDGEHNPFHGEHEDRHMNHEHLKGMKEEHKGHLSKAFVEHEGRKGKFHGGHK
jgi:hypothetical protein